MSINEPFHDPVDLCDELDSIVAAQELLRQRMVALKARYAALQSFADAGRFDKVGENGWSREEYGAVNVKHTVLGLDDAAQAAASVYDYGLKRTRELAAKVREYPQPQGSALADYRHDQVLADAVARHGAERAGVER